MSKDNRRLQKQYYSFVCLQLQGLWRHSSETANFLLHIYKWRTLFLFCYGNAYLLSNTFEWEKL